MMDTYIVVDLETTGLAPKSDRILEIGAYRVEQGRFADSYHQMVDPGMPVPPRISALTGITDEMVRGKPPIQAVIRDFLDFAGELPLLGHNLLFDYSFLKHAAVNQRLSFEKDGADTLKLSRLLLPELESRRLGALCVYYQIPQKAAHRAADDARVTALVYETLKKQFGEQRPELFEAKPLCYRAKRQSPITNAQKGYLNDLLKYHRIDMDVKVETLTKSEASRLIDGIIRQYGRISRRSRTGGKGNETV